MYDIGDCIHSSMRGLLAFVIRVMAWSMFLIMALNVRDKTTPVLLERV